MHPWSHHVLLLSRHSLRHRPAQRPSPRLIATFYLLDISTTVYGPKTWETREMWPQRFAFTTFRDAHEIERLMDVFPAWKPHRECRAPSSLLYLSCASLEGRLGGSLRSQSYRRSVLHASGRVASCLYCFHCHPRPFDHFSAAAAFPIHFPGCDSGSVPFPSLSRSTRPSREGTLLDDLVRRWCPWIPTICCSAEYVIVMIPPGARPPPTPVPATASSSFALPSTEYISTLVA